MVAGAGVATSGEWRVASGEWRVASGESRVASRSQIYQIGSIHMQFSTYQFTADVRNIRR